MWGFGANGPIRTPSWNQTPYEQSWSFGIEHEFAEFISDQRRIYRQERHSLPFSARQSELFGALGGESAGWRFQRSQPMPAGLSIDMSQLRGNQSVRRLISDPNSTIGSSFPQIQYYQLLRPFPNSPGFLQNRR